MQGLGRFEEAIELWSQLKEEAERSEGVDSARKVTATLSLATCLKASGDLTTSQIEILDCWKSVREHLTEKHEYSMMVLNQVVQSYEIQNDFEGALPWLEKQLALREQMSVETHPYTVGCRANLGMGYQSVGRQQEALPLLEFAKNHAIETFGPTEETTIQVYLCYAEATRATGQPDAGSLALQDLIRALRKDGSVEDTWIAWAQVSLMAHLVSANQLDKAEAARDEALRLTADGWGDATWHGLELQSLTGVMHMQHGRFEEAERDLIIAADWMLTNDAMPKQADTISRGYPMIGIDRILELYEVWSAAKPELDHSVKVAQWTERRKNWLADPFR
jgi:tetratricopeptide (TPR) repeat protein